jgi:hypothetical protein
MKGSLTLLPHLHPSVCSLPHWGLVRSDKYNYSLIHMSEMQYLQVTNLSYKNLCNNDQEVLLLYFTFYTLSFVL